MCQPPLTHIMRIIAPINNQLPHMPQSSPHQCLPCCHHPPSQLPPPPPLTAKAQRLRQDLSRQQRGRGGWPDERLTSMKIKWLLSSLCSYPTTMKIPTMFLLLHLSAAPSSPTTTLLLLPPLPTASSPCRGGAGRMTTRVTRRTTFLTMLD
jgi:hypothetical protein